MNNRGGSPYARSAEDRDNTCRVVVNGRKLTDFQAIYHESIQFSPNGRGLTYLAKKAGREVFAIPFACLPEHDRRLHRLIAGCLASDSHNPMTDATCLNQNPHFLFRKVPVNE